MAIVYRPQKTQEIFLSSPADICVYGGAAGGGKAGHVDTPIPTPNGFKFLGEIEDGDVLLDEQELPCSVIKAHDILIPDRCYRLSFDDGGTIDVCSEHLWTFEVAGDDLEPVSVTLNTERFVEASARYGARIAKRGSFVSLKSAEIIAPVPMRCLTVDSPSRLYLIGRTAIPTHNTFALLFEMARHYRNPNWGGVIFRHEAKQILNEGGLRDSAMELYPGMGAEYRSQPMPTFTFPSGARVSFSHINLDTEVAGWQGSQIPTIGFDELTHFSSFVFFYMMSRNRSTCGIKPYIRCSTNPDPDSWVADFIAWWIDQETGFPIKERGGVIRHFVRRPTSSGMEIVWGDTKDDVAEAMCFGRPKDAEIALAHEQLDAALLRGEDIPDEIASGPVQYVKAVRSTRSMSFVPSSVYDNAALLSKDPGYLANLKSLDRVEQARLLGGNWKVRAAAGLYFPVAHVQIVQKLSQNVMQWLRMWDLAATEPNEAHDPDWTVGLKIGRTWTGTVIVGDVIRVRKNARFVRDLVKATALADGRSCWIGLIQDPGQSGKAQFESYRDMLRGYSVFSCGSGKKKELIAEPVAAEWQGNNVALVMGDWNRAFIDELEKFPTKGVHDDQVDAFSNGYALLPPVGQPNYADAGGLRRRSRER